MWTSGLHPSASTLIYPMYYHPFTGSSFLEKYTQKPPQDASIEHSMHTWEAPYGSYSRD